MPVPNFPRLTAFTAALLASAALVHSAETPPPGKWKWEQMDNGPFFSSNLQGRHAALKTFTLKLATPDNPEAAAVNFDTMTLRWNAAWTGGFLHLPRGRDGLEGLPEPWGSVVLSSPVGPGWAHNGSFTDPRQGTDLYAPLPHNWAQWRGVYLHGNDAVLSWNNAAFQLQAAPTVSGVYTNIPNAVSPHPVPLDQSQRFFRLVGP